MGLCDPTVRSRDNALNPDITLQGWSARGDGGLKLQEYFHNGPFAGQIMVLTENAIQIGDIDPSETSKWCALNTLLVPYGGLLAANLVAGETILISGATGNFGSPAVAVALAMGAACVVAPGRNEKVLEDLKKRFGERVSTVRLMGDHETDKKAMIKAAAGPIDCVFDMLPPAAKIDSVRAAVLTVRPYGRIVLMGGVGMLGGAELSLPYPWIMRNCVTIIGQWMYPPKATTLMAGMIWSGILDLNQFSITEFHLNDVNHAVEHAAMNGGPFKMTIIKPK